QLAHANGLVLLVPGVAPDRPRGPGRGRVLVMLPPAPHGRLLAHAHGRLRHTPTLRPRLGSAARVVEGRGARAAAEPQALVHRLRVPRLLLDAPAALLALLGALSEALLAREHPQVRCAAGVPAVLAAGEGAGGLPAARVPLAGERLPAVEAGAGVAR